MQIIIRKFCFSQDMAEYTQKMKLQGKVNMPSFLFLTFKVIARMSVQNVMEKY